MIAETIIVNVDAVQETVDLIADLAELERLREYTSLLELQIYDLTEEREALIEDYGLLEDALERHDVPLVR